MADEVVYVRRGDKWSIPLIVPDTIDLTGATVAGEITWRRYGLVDGSIDLATGQAADETGLTVSEAEGITTVLIEVEEADGLTVPLGRLSEVQIWRDLAGDRTTFKTLSLEVQAEGTPPTQSPQAAQLTVAAIEAITAILAGKQDLNAKLTAFSALTGAADKLAYFTGASALAVTDLTAYARTLLAGADAAAVKTLLALVKADVGLGNVDNTSDAGKPVSTAQQAALDGKQGLHANLTSLSGITLAAVGLSFLTAASEGAQRQAIGVPRASQAEAEAAATDTETLSPLTGKQMLFANAKDAPVTVAGTGMAARTLKDWLSDLTFVESAGAVGDNVADDTVAFQRAIDQFGQFRLRPFTTYRITARLNGVAGMKIIGSEGSAIHADGAAFNNTDNTVGSRYGTNAVVILIKGHASDLEQPLVGATLSGFRIYGDGIDNRVVRPVVVQNATDVLIEGMEIDGFCVGIGVCFANCSRITIQRNYIHDFSTNLNWGPISGALVQISAIEGDNDAVGGAGSTGVVIRNNRIARMTFGATAIAAHAYQTDGINIAKAACIGFLIEGNHISFTGDAIDCFGCNGAINNNIIEDSYNFDLKFIHGASGNVFNGNVLLGGGLSNIVFGFSSVAAVTNNVGVGNVCKDPDKNGVWAASSSVANVLAGPGTDTYAPTGNRVLGGYLDPGVNGKHAVYNNIAGAGLYVSATALPGTVSTITNHASNKGSLHSPTPLRALMTMSASHTTATSTIEKIQFNTASLDSERGLNAGSYDYTIPHYGVYRITASIRTTTVQADKLLTIYIYEGSTARAQKQYRVPSASTVIPMDITLVWAFPAGAVISVRAEHNDTTALTFANAPTVARFSIEQV